MDQGEGWVVRVFPGQRDNAFIRLHRNLLQPGAL